MNYTRMILQCLLSASPSSWTPTRARVYCQHRARTAITQLNHGHTSTGWPDKTVYVHSKHSLTSVISTGATRARLKPRAVFLTGYAGPATYVRLHPTDSTLGIITNKPWARSMNSNANSSAYPPPRSHPFASISTFASPDGNPRPSFRKAPAHTVPVGICDNNSEYPNTDEEHDPCCSDPRSRSHISGHGSHSTMEVPCPWFDHDPEKHRDCERDCSRGRPNPVDWLLRRHPETSKHQNDITKVTLDRINQEVKANFDRRKMGSDDRMSNVEKLESVYKVFRKHVFGTPENVPVPRCAEHQVKPPRKTAKRSASQHANEHAKQTLVTAPLQHSRSCGPSLGSQAQRSSIDTYISQRQIEINSKVCRLAQKSNESWCIAKRLPDLLDEICQALNKLELQALREDVNADTHLSIPRSGVSDILSSHQAPYPETFAGQYGPDENAVDDSRGISHIPYNADQTGRPSICITPSGPRINELQASARSRPPQEQWIAGISLLPDQDLAPIQGGHMDPSSKEVHHNVETSINLVDDEFQHTMNQEFQNDFSNDELYFLGNSVTPSSNQNMAAYPCGTCGSNPCICGNSFLIGQPMHVGSQFI